MLKTKEEIEIEFARAVSQAQELEDVAVQLTRLANFNSKDAMNVLSQSYKGPNAMIFAQKGGELSTGLFSTADDLLRIATTLRSTADIIYRAEKTAASMIY